MSTPAKYRPAPRLVDDKDRLRQLYCEQDKTIREIAEEYANVGQTVVWEKIHEHGLDC